MKLLSRSWFVSGNFGSVAVLQKHHLLQSDFSSRYMKAKKEHEQFRRIGGGRKHVYKQGHSCSSPHLKTFSYENLQQFCRLQKWGKNCMYHDLRCNKKQWSNYWQIRNCITFFDTSISIKPFLAPAKQSGVVYLSEIYYRYSIRKMVTRRPQSSFLILRLLMFWKQPFLLDSS